jgi:hypothetical protein
MTDSNPPIPHRVWVLSDSGHPIESIGVIPGRSQFLNAMFCFFYDQQAKRRLAVEVLDPSTGESGDLFEIVPLVPKQWHPAIAFVPIEGPMPIPRAFTDAIRAASLEVPELEKTLEFLEGEEPETICEDDESESGGDWS